MTGAILGQGEMIYAVLRDKGMMKAIFEKVTYVFLEVIKGQYQATESFHGGYSVGFFQVWSPACTGCCTIKSAIPFPTSILLNSNLSNLPFRGRTKHLVLALHTLEHWLRGGWEC